MGLGFVGEEGEGWKSVSGLVLLGGVGGLRVESMLAAMAAASEVEMSELVESRRGRNTGSYSKSSSRLRLGFQLGLRVREGWLDEVRLRCLLGLVRGASALGDRGHSSRSEASSSSWMTSLW